MDPIEKLLSDLSPTPTPDGLDAAMERMFERAERRARVRRVARTFAVLGIVFALGVGFGHEIRRTNVKPSFSDFTYYVPFDSKSAQPMFDYSSASEPPVRGELRLTVEVLPNSRVGDSTPNRGV